jgi:hypothetical protein
MARSSRLLVVPFLAVQMALAMVEEGVHGHGNGRIALAVTDDGHIQATQAAPGGGSKDVPCGTDELVGRENADGQLVVGPGGNGEDMVSGKTKCLMACLLDKSCIAALQTMRCVRPDDDDDQTDIQPAGHGVKGAGVCVGEDKVLEAQSHSEGNVIVYVKVQQTTTELYQCHFSGEMMDVKDDKGKPRKTFCKCTRAGANTDEGAKVEGDQTITVEFIVGTDIGLTRSTKCMEFEAALGLTQTKHSAAPDKYAFSKGKPCVADNQCPGFVYGSCKNGVCQ